MRVLVLCLVLLMATLAAQGLDGSITYADPQRRFTFTYPAAFGQPETGTDHGVGDRVASFRFPALPGTEAVLTKGPVTVDRQALGGLYDLFTRQAIPEAELPPILEALAPVTPETFCPLLGQTDHLLRPAALSDKARAMARATDVLGNVAPKVIACTRTGSTITFDKEAGLGPGGARRRVFGAIRFLPSPYSSFQVVSFGPSPRLDGLAALTAMVSSLNVFR
jgi:hypothetical protein